MTAVLGNGMIITTMIITTIGTGTWMMDSGMIWGMAEAAPAVPRDIVAAVAE